MKTKIIVIVGPTAVGKTALAIDLAQALNGEIISGDSQQVYRKLDIGTAKATPEEQAAAPHHLIDVREVTESYSAFDFVREAKTAIEEITARGKLPIIAGGTGLYIQSLLEGYHLGGEVPHEEILSYRAQLDLLSDEDLYQRVAEQGLVIPQLNRRRAMRARSHEGKLQVHLAQLKYLLPRLVGQGIMLSRQAGGIGSRGPGESQLELNRRSVRNQITDIERQLKAVEKNRETLREKRLESPVFKIGLIGYTNAGKSTIMNQLTSKSQYEADELFATLDATTKSIHLTGNLQVTLTDTVGFIQDLPTELVSSFKSTLEESKNVDLLVHVIDASDPNDEEHEKTVLSIMKDLDMLEIPRLTLYNKADKVADFTPTQTPFSLISARSETAREDLQALLLEKLSELFVPFTIRVPFSKSYRTHDLETVAIIDQREFEEDVEVIQGYIAEKNKWKLEEFYDGLH